MITSFFRTDILQYRSIKGPVFFMFYYAGVDNDAYHAKEKILLTRFLTGSSSQPLVMHFSGS